MSQQISIQESVFKVTRLWLEIIIGLLQAWFLTTIQDSHKERISVILVYKRLVFPPTGTEGIKLNTVPGHVRKYGQLNK